MDKLVSIKGLVIRTTPVIPDMKTGNSVLMTYKDFLTDRLKLSFVVKSVITQSMFLWTGVRLQSRPDARGKFASLRIRCK